TAHIYCEELFGIVGENFTFPAKIDPKVVDITWNKDKNLVVEREGQNNLKYFGDLQNRAVLQEDGSLTILNLQKSDSGTYELVSWDSVKDHNSKFKLDVLDPLPEPTISCNTSAGVNLVLNCTADFQRPLIYTWELSNEPQSYQGQEHSIPLENVDHTVKATCVIKFSQTARSSEISLIQCLP
ncbi:LFA3 protein, partial [Malurus elegans]|nr:LFA3 protein [Malurus elegans]